MGCLRRGVILAEMTPVRSTLLAAAGYDIEANVLFLRFVSDSALYAYQGVERDIYDALLQCDSKGAFFHQNIRDRFPYTRV
jgi:hypothetical protein